jgi:hypothetical protein
MFAAMDVNEDAAAYTFISISASVRRAIKSPSLCKTARSLYAAHESRASRKPKANIAAVERSYGNFSRSLSSAARRGLPRK